MGIKINLVTKSNQSKIGKRVILVTKSNFDKILLVRKSNWYENQIGLKIKLVRK